jgi:hypothetical protein
MGNLGDIVAETRPFHGFPCSAPLVLPPLATLYLVFTPPGAEQAPA